jgi:hypothetical protein
LTTSNCTPWATFGIVFFRFIGGYQVDLHTPLGAKGHRPLDIWKEKVEPEELLPGEGILDRENRAAGRSNRRTGACGTSAAGGEELATPGTAGFRAP